MKVNRKGFTLVELLVVIAVIGLVLGLSTFGIIRAYNTSKEKSLALSRSSILEAARIFADEKTNDDDRWIYKNNTDQSYMYFCMTVKELINNGILGKDKITDYLDDYVLVKKSKITFSIDDLRIVAKDDLDSDVIAYNACNGLSDDTTVSGDIKIEPIVSYTDEIEADYIYSGAAGNITKKECLYNVNGDKTILKTEVTSDNKCVFSSLKSNTKYDIRSCVTVDDNYKCSATKNYMTKSFEKPSISLSDKVTINYNDSNIKEGGASHYFKSTLIGKSLSSVKECTIKNDNITCSDVDTTTIKHNVWYKVDGNSIVIEYSNDGSSVITARTVDKTGNYTENTKDISVYKTVFKKGTADTIDNGGSDIERICITDKNGSCAITSPNAVKVGYTMLGWNTSENATTGSWAANTSKNVNSNNTYYPIFRINVGIVRYYMGASDATLRASTTSLTGIRYDWTKNDSGLISRSMNGSAYTSDFHTFNYGQNTTEDGLVDYHNDKHLYTSRTGYTTVRDEEWKCMGTCAKDIYSQYLVYNASDFCDTSSTDCIIELKVNWIPINYNVRYNNTCTLTKSGSMENSSHTYDQDKALTDNGFGCSSVVTFNYNGATGGNTNSSLTANSTFNGWSKTNGGSKEYNNKASVKNLTSTDNDVVDLYTVWTNNSIKLPSPTKDGYLFDGWFSDSGLTTSVGSGGSNYTPKSGTETLYAKWTSSASIPTNAYCKSGLVYNGSKQTLTNAAGTGYTFSGNEATNAGEYTITASLNNGYRWSDNTSGTKSFTCLIAKATPTITLSATSGTVAAGNTIDFNESANVKGKFSVSSSDRNKATVSQASSNAINANTNNKVTVTGVAAGNATITVGFTPTDTTNYNNADSKTYAVTVINGTTKPTAATYCKSGLVYNGSLQTLTNAAGTGYTFSGNTATNAGKYTITAKLNNGYRWNDNTTADVTFECSIAKADIVATGSDYSADYDTSSHTISVNVTTPSSGTTVYYSESSLNSSNYSTAGNTSAPTRSTYGTTTVYWYVHSTNANYNDKSGSNKIKITDHTAPKLYISVYNASDPSGATSIKNCDSSAGTTVCEVTSGMSTANSIKISTKDNTDNNNCSGMNTAFTIRYNTANNTTSYNSTYTSTSNLTLTATSSNYQATVSNIASGYRVLYVTVRDNAGNTTSMTLKLPIGLCSLSNPSGCSSMYFCKTSQTKVHEMPYATSNDKVTEGGVTYTNQYFTAKKKVSVHVVNDSIYNNNTTRFYLVCFDNASYLSSLHDGVSEYYTGPFAADTHNYYHTTRIQFGNVNSAAQCGYVYYGCLRDNTSHDCSDEECYG